ncbi:MAG: AAA family ATPase [Thermodesulfobacteriota bacterium]|nr:AAA family ATPase [Thermodesulfobacteriota bacterium]
MKKIGIIGAQSTGKTAMAERLMLEYRRMDNPPVVMKISEIARECPYPMNRGMTLPGQRWMVGRQLREEIWGRSVDVMICDRTVLDPVVYAIWAANHADDAAPWAAWLNYMLPFAMDWCRSFDLLLWCRPNGNPPSVDGFRDPDPQWQKDIDAIFQYILQDSGLAYRQVEMVTVPVVGVVYEWPDYRDVFEFEPTILKACGMATKQF